MNMVTTVRQYFSKAKATGKGQTLLSYISVCQKPCLLIMQVLQVEAVDGDHGIRNPITYSITGGPKHLFAINKLNGLVYINVSFLFGSFHHVNTSTNNRLKWKCFKAPIDRESEDARNGAFILEVGRTNGAMLQWYNGMMVVLWWLWWILDLGWNINGAFSDKSCLSKTWDSAPRKPQPTLRWPQLRFLVEGGEVAPSPRRLRS